MVSDAGPFGCVGWLSTEMLDHLTLLLFEARLHKEQLSVDLGSGFYVSDFLYFQS